MITVETTVRIQSCCFLLHLWPNIPVDTLQTFYSCSCFLHSVSLSCLLNLSKSEPASCHF